VISGFDDQTYVLKGDLITHFPPTMLAALFYHFYLHHYTEAQSASQLQID
jgi:hypothetical protein